MFIATLQQLTQTATILVQYAALYTSTKKATEWETKVKTQTAKISENIPVAILYCKKHAKAYGCIGHIVSKQTTQLQNSLHTIQQIDDYLLNLSFDLHMASVFFEFAIIPILLAATDEHGNITQNKNTSDAIFLILSKIVKIPALAWNESLEKLDIAAQFLAQEQQDYAKLVNKLTISLQNRLRNYCTILDSITHSLQQEKLQFDRNLITNFKNQPPEWMPGVHRQQSTGTIQHFPACSCTYCKCVIKKWNQHYN